MPQPRVGARRTVLGTIRQLPRFLRLFVGLLADGRVSVLDRLLVVGAMAYIVSPLDFMRPSSSRDEPANASVASPVAGNASHHTPSLVSPLDTLGEDFYPSP
ncbi:MAG: hypothetical protein MUD17_07365 [Gemmatimonadaceae bacterium]|nr:hypothetical protein [Gemmatimonadaceae bacterium]